MKYFYLFFLFNSYCLFPSSSKIDVNVLLHFRAPLSGPALLRPTTNQLYFSRRTRSPGHDGEGPLSPFNEVQRPRVKGEDRLSLLISWILNPNNSPNLFYYSLTRLTVLTVYACTSRSLLIIVALLLTTVSLFHGPLWYGTSPLSPFRSASSTETFLGGDSSLFSRVLRVLSTLLCYYGPDKKRVYRITNR